MTQNQKIAAILVGGKGTRLQPILPHIPKPLAPINGEPFLKLIISQIANTSITQIILLTGHLHQQIQDYCEDGKKFGVKIMYSHENQPLGTGGALANAAGILGQFSEFILLNGDTYLETSLNNLIDYPLSKETMGVIGTMMINDSSRYGSVQINSQTNNIESLAEKSSHKSGIVNAGIYKLSSAILKEIPQGKFCSLETEVFPTLIKNGMILKGLDLLGKFYDIGTPASYEEFQILNEVK